MQLLDYYKNQNYNFTYPCLIEPLCFVFSGAAAPDWNEGLCPNENVMSMLAKVGLKEEQDSYYPMRGSGTVSDLVKQIAVS